MKEPTQSSFLEGIYGVFKDDYFCGGSGSGGE